VRRWLAMQYVAINSTLPLLRFALQHLETVQKDQFTQTLRDYYHLKLQDEADHDDWIVSDLERLGVTKEALQRWLPPAAMTAMLGSQYYLIAHYHPGAYLGYIGLVEGFSPSTEQIRNLIVESKAPEEAFSTYKIHAELDVEHRKEFKRVLDAVPDNPGLREAILANGIRSGEFSCQAIEGLLDTPEL
jgi:hypothetical protein